MKKVIPGKIKTQLRLDGYYNVLNGVLPVGVWLCGKRYGAGRSLCRKRVVLNHY